MPFSFKTRCEGNMLEFRVTKLLAPSVWLTVTADSQVNCKNCLKSTGLHEFVGDFVWFCLNALYQMKKCLNFDGLPKLEKNWAGTSLWIDIYHIWSTQFTYYWPKFLHSTCPPGVGSRPVVKVLDLNRFQGACAPLLFIQQIKFLLLISWH